MTSMKECFESGVALIGMKNCMTLFQTAYLMSQEGNKRATASEVAERAASQFGLKISPSNIGQAFSAMGIATTISRGKTKYVLDSTEIEPILRVGKEECTEISDRLEESLSEYQDIAGRVDGLINQLREALKLDGEERKLRAQIRQVQGE
ncbi:hypothetical protein [Dehalococcoides mccartyi]|uniref:Uncharacterized protein n=1 Tax=Dehalococcoides mccartyi (strain CBDB1) TaxID=255470 RepID=A0A916P011_DEHMC|nr:hypothetical protein [Dehalococcoides mccartyi]AQX73750.1 hypothetical protein B1775_06300 [Dehalococcoides mccartyi]CAI83504.1 hypothetical protein cbdbA1482 [Dehalococcoides mccartyi CBDB1]